MILESSLLSEKAKPGNLILAGTDKPTSLPITFSSLAEDPIDLSLAIASGSNSFAVTPDTLALAKGTMRHVPLDDYNVGTIGKSHILSWFTPTDTPGSAVVTFTSPAAATETAILTVTAPPAISLTYTLHAYALPPADFGDKFGSGW